MDRDHRLDAPDNDSLQTIEQIEDRSELTTLYPHSHSEWEGVDLLSREAREEKRNQEQLHINISIRKWFPVIGLLAPIPFILGSILTTLAFTYLRVESMAFLLLPVAFAIVAWFYISYRSVKGIVSIFYAHSIKATPFVLTLLSLIVLGLQGHYVAIEPYYTDSLVYNALLSSGVILLTSIILSGLLIFIWTTRTISAKTKVLCIGFLALIILLTTLYINVF